MDAREFLSIYNQAENNKQDEQIKKLKQEIKDLKESNDIIQEEKTGYKSILKEKEHVIKDLKNEVEELNEKLRKQRQMTFIGLVFMLTFMFIIALCCC